MAYANVYRPDRLFLPQQKLAAFAASVSTPFYLYDEDGIRKSARLIRGSFCWASRHMAWFPVSVNSCPQILRIFREEGFGALARSVPELALAQSSGFSEITFHTAAMTAAAVQAAIRANCTVIFDSPGQIEAFEGCLPDRCLLRCQPANAAPAAVLKQKSGMERSQIMASAARLRDLGVRQIGLHCHASSGGCDEGFYSAAAVHLIRLAKEVFVETGIRVDCIDPGGGLDVRSDPPRGMVQLSRVGALVRDVFENELPAGFAPAIHTEFGRYAVARHGLLISRVAEVRERTRTYAILDTSTAQLPDLLLGGARHPISVIGNCAKRGRKVYSVHGCTPDARERICDRAILPALEPGSLVAIHHSGACCESMQLSRALLPRAGSFLYTREGQFVPTA